MTGQTLDESLARERAAQQQIGELEKRLLAAETKLAPLAQLELERDEAIAERDLAHAERDEARELLERSRAVHQEMVTSLSWRATQPLRAAKRAADRRRAGS